MWVTLLAYSALSFVDFSLVFTQTKYQAREWRKRVLGRDLMFLWRPSSETCRQLAICLGSWCGVGDPFVHWVQESVGVVSLGRGRGNGWPRPLWPQLDFLRLKHVIHAKKNTSFICLSSWLGTQNSTYRKWFKKPWEEKCKFKNKVWIHTCFTNLRQ